MFVLVVGGGKVGTNVTRTLRGLKHEIVLVEQDERRYQSLEEEFQHGALYGDGTELHVLEQAGIKRPPDILVAVTGDDEDNIVICEIARKRYFVPKVIARVNDPRNQTHFDMLGVSPTVCATSSIMALIEHEVPESDIIRLLQLRDDELEIVEVPIGADSPSSGKRVEQLKMPQGTLLISVAREGRSEIASGSTKLAPGDRVLAILQPGREDELRRVLLKKS